jgi:SRSO17 transposase
MYNKWIFPDNWQVLVIALCSILHQRSAWRLSIIFAGIVFARGRKTVTSWFRAAGISRQYKAFYYFIGSIGQKTEAIATVLFEFMVKLIYRKNKRILMAIDDSPTKRYGPKVQGTGIHRNPTVGPDGAKFVYGHVWVTLSALIRHKSWGTIGLPLLAKLYVRARDIGSVPRDYKVRFKNKLQQAADMVKWASECCNRLGKRLWIVTDGGFTKAGFLKPAVSMGATVITRLRKDAALHTLPGKVKKRKRGRPRKYGQRIHLQDEVNKNKGWFSINVTLYGQEQTKQVKIFNATYRPAGGVVLVLIVREGPGCWRAFMCTNLSATAEEILEAVADRYAIEQNFHDLKEIEGAGQQQVRNFWANIGAFHLNMWVHTMVELWAWNKGVSAICDRSNSPWDDFVRRPSHADRCAGLRRDVLKKTFFEVSGHDRKNRKIVRQFYKLMKLAG